MQIFQVTADDGCS